MELVKIKEIIVFTSSWCGPCKTYAPTIKKVSEELGITIESIDIESNRMEELHKTTTGVEEVRSVPTTIAIREGEITASWPGVMSEHKLKKWIQDN